MVSKYNILNQWKKEEEKFTTKYIFIAQNVGISTMICLSQMTLKLIDILYTAVIGTQRRDMRILYLPCSLPKAKLWNLAYIVLIQSSNNFNLSWYHNNLYIQ